MIGELSRKDADHLSFLLGALPKGARAVFYVRYRGIDFRICRVPISTGAGYHYQADTAKDTEFRSMAQGSTAKEAMDRALEDD